MKRLILKPSIGAQNADRLIRIFEQWVEKGKMKKVLLSAMIFAFVTAGSASSTSPDDERTKGIGIGRTVSDTWGFLYRQHFANNMGFSGSLGGWLRHESGRIGNVLSLFYTVGDHRFATSWSDFRLKIYLQGYLANIYKQDIMKNPGPLERSWRVGAGFGPGVEFFFVKYFSLHLEMPWMTFFELSKGRFTFQDSLPNFSAGWIYYF